MEPFAKKNDRLLIKFLATILKFYLLGLLFGCLSTRFFSTGHRAFEIYKSPQFLLGPLIFLLLGLAIGALLLLLGKPKNGIRFLFYGTLTGLILYCITIVSVQSYDWYGSRYLANIEANEDFLSSSTTYPLQERRAFKMLTDKYKDPNDLRLVEKSVTRYDSIVDRAKTDAFDVGFVYFRKYLKGRYRSMCTIAGDHAILQYFDRPLSEAEDYKMDSSNNEGLRDGLKVILDDSTKLSLDSVTKATIRKKIKSRKIVLDTLPEAR